MKLNALSRLTQSFPFTETMPVLFLGHGSPMNAIEDNEFSRGWKSVGKTLPRPAAILCISAHWETSGTYVTVMEKPRTIHDFGGFPAELYAVQYPAPGSPELAKETMTTVGSTEVGQDERWGLDHGAWSVIRHLFPEADVPVVQLSLDRTKEARYHYDLAKELSSLRNKGILIIGSGNMVHNLSMVDRNKMNHPDYGYDWAIEASGKMKRMIREGDHSSLVDYTAQGRPFQLAIPTPEHYLPLLYALAVKAEGEEITIFNDKAVMGSLTMTSLRIGEES